MDHNKTSLIDQDNIQLADQTHNTSNTTVKYQADYNPNQDLPKANPMDHSQWAKVHQYHNKTHNLSLANNQDLKQHLCQSFLKCNQWAYQYKQQDKIKVNPMDHNKTNNLSLANN